MNQRNDKTIGGKELRDRLALAKQVPGLAHLPAFGLMAGRGWDYENKNLIAQGQVILAQENIVGQVYETAPALFWYRTLDGEVHCHEWKP